MQKAVPHEAAASVAAPAASAASSNLFILPSRSGCDDTRGRRSRTRPVFSVDQAERGGARGALGVNRGEGCACTSDRSSLALPRSGGRTETLQPDRAAGLAVQALGAGLRA